MARNTYRGNLSSAIFPMTLADAGRTVISPQLDQNFDRRVDPAGEQKDAGIPQAMYLENIIPTVNGYQSVGYIQRIPLPVSNPAGPTVNPVRVRAAFIVPDSSSEAVILFRSDGGSYNDVISSTIDASYWLYNAGATVPSGLNHSIATVRGVNYWCDGTYLYTFAVNVVNKQVTFTDISGSVTGVTVANIKYICSSFNYLILLMDDGSIAWSSTLTPTDFTVSLVTGAGSETPSGAENSKFLVTHSNGFYIYCDNSVVLATYTGNSRYPWKFVPVSGAGGYSDPYSVYGSYQSTIQYGIDKSNKLQIIEGNTAQLVAPEISTYLERKTYKDAFDYATNLFSRVGGFGVTAATRLTFVLDRYIILSFSLDYDLSLLEYQYAFVYDILLQRYGVLKVNHSYILANNKFVLFVPLEIGQFPYAWNLDIYTNGASFQGVLLLGKFQAVRDKRIKLEGVEIESVEDPAYGVPNFSLTLLPSLDGKNFTTPIPLTATHTGPLVTAPAHKTALNFCVLLKGSIDVNTIQLDFSVAGDR